MIRHGPLDQETTPYTCKSRVSAWLPDNVSGIEGLLGRQPRKRNLVVDDAGDGKVAYGVGVHRLEGDMRLARQGVGDRVHLKKGRDLLFNNKLNNSTFISHLQYTFHQECFSKLLRKNMVTY